MEPAIPRVRPPDAAPSILKNPLHHIPRWSRQRGGYVTYVNASRSPSATRALLVIPRRSLPHTWLLYMGHGRVATWIARKERMYRWASHHRASASTTSPDDIEPMDPEELAMLNSIINTRRSMAAAQALAKQEVTPHDTPKTSRHGTGDARGARVRFAPLPFPEDDMELDTEELDLDELPRSRDTDTDSASFTPTDSSGSSLHRRPSCKAFWTSWSRNADTLSLRRWASTGRDASPSPEELESPSFGPPRVSLEERRRRRQHILSQRPGGTGMVTLLDGKRIPARQVGDPKQEHDTDADVDAQLWGFAALERQRARVQASTPRRLSLSSERAAEVRRRHEHEMHALGAEALKKVRRDKPKSPEHTHFEFRSPMDPSISMPSPSPHLPRRPDAKGILVVPLPQLGRRPVHPYEGRSWLYKLPFDDMDVSSDTKSRDEGVRRRATTDAARQEIVHASRHKHRHDWADEFWPRPSATRAMGT